MDEVKLADYFAGLHRETVAAGRLDAASARALDMEPGTIVWLSDWTLTKLRFRHSEVTYQHYLRIPSVLREGFALHGRKPASLEFYWVERWEPATHGFCLCLKRTKTHDVYITTFHPIHFSEVRRKYRGAERTGLLIRPLKTELAQRLRRGASHV